MYFLEKMESFICFGLYGCLCSVLGLTVLTLAYLIEQRSVIPLRPVQETGFCCFKVWLLPVEYEVQGSTLEGGIFSLF